MMIIMMWWWFGRDVIGSGRDFSSIQEFAWRDWENLEDVTEDIRFLFQHLNPGPVEYESAVLAILPCR